MKMGKKGNSSSKPSSTYKSNAKKDYVQKKPSQIKRIKALKAIHENFHTKRENNRHSSDTIENNEDFQVSYDKSNESFDFIPSDIPFIKLTAPQSISRLIYPNPVCFLTTLSPNLSIESDQRLKLNVMTVSWLMPTNNYGGIAITIHKSRHSAFNLLQTKEFILSVPTALQRELLLTIGKCSGKNMNKFEKKSSSSSSDGGGSDRSSPIISGLEITEPGQWDSKNREYKKPLPENWKELNVLELKDTPVAKHASKSLLDAIDKNLGNKFSVFEEDSDDESESGIEKEEEDKNHDENNMDSNQYQKQEQNHQNHQKKQSHQKLDKLMAIAQTIAHMKCHLITSHDGVDAGHHIILAQIDEAFVHPNYWSNRGKCFVSKGNCPPILTFLGSQCFGFIKASGDEFPIE